MKLEKVMKFTAIGILVGAVVILAMAAFVYATQWLWNELVPTLFGGPVITYWQMLGLLVLTKIILWPLGGGRGHWRRHRGQGRMWAARWESMSPEEREQFKAKMKTKWCMPKHETPPSGPATV
ncbi:MAG: hypothetical protein JNK10_14340 [Cyclobacteriaceae bacterium]|nr:hypothetical protein [Cyclobacteriaceae bacterium]